jgi:hypothetical protein
MSDIHIQSHDTGNAPGEKQWDTTEMMAEFSVDGFCAPFVVVRRKSDGVRGTLEFKHSPRVYFDFQPEQG